MDPTKPDLSDVTTDELADEIRSRHTHVLMILVRDAKKIEENADIITRHLKGPMWALLGLAEVFRVWGAKKFEDPPDMEDGD